MLLAMGGYTVWALLAAGAWYAAMSLVTFGAFWVDKRRAVRGDRRTPEKTLHTLSLLGGFPGAAGAMLLIRHKNRKPWFIAVTVGCALLHAGVWTGLVYLLLRG